MKRLLASLGLIAIALWPGTGHAQNVAENAGRWWNQPPPAGLFTLYNPLTTLYGRIGASYSFGVRLHNLLYDIGQTWSRDGAGGAAIGVGARLMPILRYELQASGIFNTIVNIHLGGPVYPFARADFFQLMNILHLDVGPMIGNPWGLNPYASGGVGVSVNRISEDQLIFGAFNDPRYSRSSAHFAWMLGVGLQWQPMNNLILDFGYRYLFMGRLLETQVIGGYSFRSVDAHQLMISLVVPFDGLARAFGN